MDIKAQMIITFNRTYPRARVEGIEEVTVRNKLPVYVHNIASTPRSLSTNLNFCAGESGKRPSKTCVLTFPSRPFQWNSTVREIKSGSS